LDFAKDKVTQSRVFHWGRLPAHGVVPVEEVRVGLYVRGKVRRVEVGQTGVDVARQRAVMALELVDELRNQVRRPADDERLQTEHANTN